MATSFFEASHSLSLLVLFLGTIVWQAFIAASRDTRANVAWGLAAAVCSFTVVGATYLPDGPFVRPHPVVWRTVLALSICYLLALAFLLFQSLGDARQWVAFVFDGSLGIPLPEKSYAEDCSVTFQNIYNQMDMFVWAHAVGWYVKALIVRDHWLLWIISVMFEVMEYSLEHQLPNFAECWWDHWVLDVLTCNWLGIWAGMRTCAYLEMKTYSWKSIQDIPTLRGKLQRSAAQFTPRSWTSFDWAASRSLRGYCVVVVLVTLVLVDELNLFYLKALLWIPVSHPIVLWRTVLHAGMGAVAVRETYQKTTKLGAQAWIAIAIVLLETAVTIKWSKGMFTKPFPAAVKTFWAVFSLVIFVAFPLWKFVVYPRLSLNKRV